MSSKLFCPFFIPQTISGKNPRPRRAYEEWQDEDQEGHYYNLFEHLIVRLGGSLQYEYSLRSEMKTMNLEKLFSLAR